MAVESGSYDQATIQRRQAIAQAMLGDAVKPQDIRHWAQGLAQLGRAGLGGYQLHQANEDAKALRAQDNAALLAILGGASSTPATPTPSAAPAIPAPKPPANVPVATAMSTPARAEVMPSAKVWGDKEAEAAGIYEPAAPKMGPGVKVAQAMAPQAGLSPAAPAPVAAPTSAPQGGAVANMSPQQKAILAAGLRASEDSPARKIAMAILSGAVKPQEYGFQTLPDGTMLRTDPRKGSVEPIYQAATKPTFGDTGEIDSQTGQPVKGFIDVNKRTVEPYRPKAAEPQPSTIPPVPAGVDPKVWREAQSKRATEEGMPADTKVVSSLRNEVQGLPSYKNLAQAAPVYKSMTEAAGRDNRAADVNLIYGMAKIMDPGSVVRESEMTVAQAIATLPQQLQAALKSQMTEAGRLTPELRQMIMQEARSRILAYQGMFNQDANMYRGIAQRGRMNEADVLPTFGPFEEFKPSTPAAAQKQGGAPVKVTSPDEARKLPKGTRIILPDGSLGVVP